MRSILVLCAAAGLLAAGFGCGRGYYVYRAGIVTADTEEGRACRRECLGVIGVCGNYAGTDRAGRSVPVFIEAGPYSREHGCPGVISDCLETCPGARVDAEAPPAMIYIDKWGNRYDSSKPEPDDEDDDHWH